MKKHRYREYARNKESVTMTFLKVLLQFTDIKYTMPNWNGVDMHDVSASHG